MNIDAAHLADLDKLSMQQILDASLKMAPPSYVRLAPVLDGRGLPRHPFAPDAPTVSSKVPLLIGINRTETTYLFDDPKNFELTWEELPARIQRFLGPKDAAKTVTEYRSLMPKATASDIFFDVSTQITMGRNAYMVADRKASQNAAPVYFYELDWNTPADGGKWQCPHTLEIPLVFDNAAKVPSMFGGTVPPEAQKLSDQMSDAWIAFARSGDPNTKAIPSWPAYDPGQRQAIRFNVESQIVKDPLGARIGILTDAPDWDMVRTTL
jgi:para-nitrobenzyl esterase